MEQETYDVWVAVNPYGSASKVYHASPRCGRLRRLTNAGLGLGQANRAGLEARGIRECLTCQARRQKREGRA